MVEVFLTFKVALHSPLQGFVPQFSTPGCEVLDEPRLCHHCRAFCDIIS